MTVIEVASIRPPREARKPGHVIAADGAAFECWPEKLNKLQVGQRYAVEVETREWQGRPIRKITKAQPAAHRNGKQPTPANAAHTPRLPPSAAAEVSENCSSVGTVSERSFVATVLCAFIAAGKVGLDADEIAAAIDTRARRLPPRTPDQWVWRCPALIAGSARCGRSHGPRRRSWLGRS
jgi:hypothetical protein